MVIRFFNDTVTCLDFKKCVTFSIISSIGCPWIWRVLLHKRWVWTCTLDYFSIFILKRTLIQRLVDGKHVGSLVILVRSSFAIMIETKKLVK